MASLVAFSSFSKFSVMTASCSLMDFFEALPALMVAKAS